MAIKFQSSNQIFTRVGWTTLPLQSHPDIGRLQTTPPPHRLFTSIRPRRNRIVAVALSDKKGEYEAKVRNITQTVKESLSSRKPDLVVEQLEIVDLLQRFGVDHLFRNQISEALHRQYQSRDELHSLDLHQLSLRFRLLREHGYHLSSAAKDIVREYENAQGWKKEIADLVSMEFDRWWKELGLAKELKLARDETWKWHLWALVALPDPHLTKERIELTKLSSLVYIIDDIFDIYGNQEDLSLFTEAVNRWDLAIAEKLPDYMKKSLKAVFDITSYISHVICVNHGRNPEHHLRKAWKDQFNAFLVESKWVASGQLPTTDEYMKIMRTATGVPLALVHLMFLLGQGFDDYENNNDAICTNMVTSIATILRLGNDLGGAKDENHVGYDGSYIKCYMNENEGSSMKDAKEHSIARIWNSWKYVNGLCLKLPHPYPNSSPYTIATFKQGCLNLGRMVLLMYNYDKDPSQTVLEDFMHSFFNL
ncbi:hypothetical protein V2J09_001631 [Rumex salicifolius]